MRVLVVADVSNLFFTIKRTFNGLKLDYRKFLNVTTKGAKTYRALAYGSKMEEFPRNGFCQALETIGFETRFKVTKTYQNSDGSRAVKADWDVGITVDVISMLNDFDVLILGSADGDMSPLFRYLKEKGKVCRVIGCRISRELRDTADSWEEITEELLES